ncbi:rhomboid family intramembrane serine protease [Rhodobacter maris]|uniref:Membrane associated rhomboid family serine protease n=1 Tax=Rhodobacter maris TaxID=446682 RepID=A0A285RL48_9RHOB|nr:rhomboid family intramembrane serine protease [Rhodobacter maris]SOB94458.1 membrane associated rhomboid family serine protease [Rhodobacter maris]
MFPIRDHNPSNRAPWVTWGLIALNCVVYVLTADWGGHMRNLWVWGALYPDAVTHGVYLHGLFTYMFLHAGLMHIGGNMLFLWVFGDNLEDQLGPLGFLLFYIAGGLAAAGAQIALDPWSPVPMVGASGAIAAVMGGYLLMFPRARVDILVILIIIFKIFTIRAWIVLGFWFGLQLLNSLDASGDGVAYIAHIGGFLAGLAMVLPLFLARGGPAFWRDTQGQPPHPSIDYAATTVPVVRRRKR